ncbi:MAG: GNAT family N-acetyltransferase [Mycobacteriales bacterium]
MTVEIRDGIAADVPTLTEIYNYYVEHSPATFDLEPFTVEARHQWFSHYSPSGPHRLLVAADGGDVVGYATSSKFRPKAAYDPSVEVTVYLHPTATGAGLGAALYERLFAALRDEGLHRAYAAITQPNEASVALHRRFGFTDVGTMTEVGRKFDRWWDVLMMQRPLP